MQYLSLPNDMLTVLAGEPTDFTIEGKSGGKASSTFLLLFGSTWSLLTGALLYGFLHPLFTEGAVTFSLNEEMVTATPDNLTPLLLPGIFFGIFILIGLGFLLGGILALVKKPGYYAGTPTRLVHYEKGRIRTYDWQKFNGNLQVNSRKGTLMLELMTGHINRNGGYVPTRLYIKTKADVLEVERLIRQRVQAAKPQRTA
jgi:hypothetical protein